MLSYSRSKVNSEKFILMNEKEEKTLFSLSLQWNATLHFEFIII